ncbi:MAG: DUF2149 domain-containing protein [Pseudomonadales bacterium]|nr:DUF2149 domain-containing protein [Pseudomonadales bacterium]
MKKRKQAPWQRSVFADSDDDPLAGFVNIMDVMLVFSLGLILAIVAQSKDLQAHFKLDKETVVKSGKELVDSPDLIKQIQNGSKDGMESLGQVYRDPETGKLILIEMSDNEN